MTIPNGAIDNGYIVKIRRELHMYPETEFDLPKTVALVCRELDEAGIPHTDRFGPSSVVGEIGPKDAKFAIGLRADMDALPLTEKTGLPYSSKIPGKMHACGHDAHTAMLLSAARALKSMESELNVRVRLLFQPCEEGPFSGAKMMVKNGVMEGLDEVLGQHVDMAIPSGTVGVLPGVAMAASHPILVEFFGRTAHAARPAQGCDALAMAVKCYTEIQFMLTRELNPLTDECVCNIGSLRGGETTNVVPDYARMQISLRTYTKELDERVFSRIARMASRIAEEVGGTANVSGEIKAIPLVNDPELCARLMESARKIVKPGDIAECRRKISSEDFSYYAAQVPGALMRLGMRSEEKGLTHAGHENAFNVDEDVLHIGAEALTQFVLDESERIGK